MKKSVFMAVAAVMLLGLAACGSKNNDKVSIVGTWKVTHMTLTELGKTLNFGEAEMKAMGYSNTMTFNENNTCIANGMSEGEAVNLEGTYTYADGVLTITSTEDDELITETYEVTKLTKTTLVLYQGGTEIDEETGESYTSSAELTLTRQ